jgi:putative glutathione S-transferase
LIYRALKKLEDTIPVSVVDPSMGPNGWAFVSPDGTLTAGSTPDHLFGSRFLYEVYMQADPHFTGRVTVPVLWDKHRRTIVNNESSEIIRMLNSAFDEWGDASLDFCPDELRPAIDEVNRTIYANVNNGVYRCGFATTQAAYEEAFSTLFAELDCLEALLGEQRYLTGEYLTEADIRLFTTLIRFDAVYHGHFKCNLRRLADYPHLSGWLRELYQWPGVAATVDFQHIKHHYYGSHRTINPTGIVPLGPRQDFSLPHGRERLSGRGIARDR